MTVSVAHVVSMLRGLLPRGKAWEAETGTVFASLLTAIAQEPTRLLARVDVLFDEADPRTTTETIDEWENDFGLPGKCEQPATLSARRVALVAKVTANAPPDFARINELAAQAGYVVTVKEYVADLYVCTSNCNASLYDEWWVFTWDVTAATGAQNALLECLLEDMAPRHGTLRVFFI
jgi:uncharacterized protein YmfQ (DUF2313 family)